MSHVGLDLFDFGGKQHLICVDHWSGYPMFSALSSSTSSAVINVLKGWFNLLGWPQSIRLDGGPHFAENSLSSVRIMEFFMSFLPPIIIGQTA